MIKSMFWSSPISKVSKSLLILFLASTCAQKTEEVEELPNVILFLVDDLGWKDLSGYGSELYQTPNTDQLASEGVKFTNAYAACTVCSPTRASILTGKYPARIQCTDWISGHEKPFAKLSPPDWTQHIRKEDVTLAEKLKEMGYSTIHIGKWHLGEAEEHWPEFHGFDSNIGGWKMGMPKRKNKQGGYFVPYHNPRLSDGPEGEYLTERLATEAVKYIQAQKSKPFFMNFWFYNVHTPLQAKEEKIAKYDSLVNKDKLQANPTYAAMVEHMDDAIGLVTNQLKQSGIYDNTIIIFASDNGGLLGVKGNPDKKPAVTSNAPLRSGKGDMYEGGVRIPFIISWPQKITSGRVSDVLTISPDIYPTVLGLIQKNTSLPARIDGIDLSNHLLSEAKPKRNAIYWHYPHYHTEGAVPYSAVRSDNWKLTYNYEMDKYELFNLESDIGETNDVSTDFPRKVEELKVDLRKWKEEVGAQEPVDNINYDPEQAEKWKNKW